MRSYGQYCPIARGAEVLAERWTPIIVRNLLHGCRTFNELSDGAPGLSRALLTKRLRELERAGLLTITPKPDGRGSYYDPTQAGREAWDVLAALGTWGDRWTDILPEHGDPNAVLWSWCHNYQNVDALPHERTVVQFEFRDERGRWIREWFHVEDRAIELCRFDPGFGVDLAVRIDDPVPFANWHLGLVEWRDALRAGVTLTGPQNLQRALPTWNTCPRLPPEASSSRSSGRVDVSGRRTGASVRESRRRCSVPIGSGSDAYLPGWWPTSWPVFPSFQTVAEVRFGALRRGWGDRRTRQLEAEIGRATILHS